jgi:predicted nuclease of predicted toxin-antitoxin system
MRLWFDVHLDPRLAEWASQFFGVEAKSFDDLGYRRTKDKIIFDAAKSLGDVVILTKDADFVELVERFDPPPQIVWLTIGNTSTPVLKSVLAASMAGIFEKLKAGDRFIEVSHA